MAYPSRREILEKYRGFISTEDFELLCLDSPPNPADLQKKGEWLEVLGQIGEYLVALWKPASKTVVVVSTIGGFFQGCEYIDKYVRIGANHVHSLVDSCRSESWVPADEFLFVVPRSREEHPRGPNGPAAPQVFIATSTSTSTSSTVTSFLQHGLPTGSGVVPFSKKWTRDA